MSAAVAPGEGAPAGPWRIRRWTDADLHVLKGSNTLEMTRHLGARETERQVLRRHERYLRGWDAGRPHMFAILGRGDRSVGGVGWWDSAWEGEAVLEAGWGVLPEAQGRGAATAGVRLMLDDARASGGRSVLAAFPRVENAASNALCRTVGFERRGTLEEEFRGVAMTLNVWVYRLDAHG